MDLRKPGHYLCRRTKRQAPALRTFSAIRSNSHGVAKLEFSYFEEKPSLARNCTSLNLRLAWGAEVLLVFYKQIPVISETFALSGKDGSYSFRCLDHGLTCSGYSFLSGCRYWFWGSYFGEFGGSNAEPWDGPSRDRQRAAGLGILRRSNGVSGHLMVPISQG